MYEEKRDPISRAAAAPLLSDRVGCVINSSNQIALASAGGNIDGVLYAAVTATGDEATIYTEGNILARSGGTCSAGREAMVDGSAKFVDATTGNQAVGRFLTGTNLADQPVLLQLYRRGQSQRGAQRMAVVPLAAVDTAGGVFSWANPEATSILINRVLLDVTTKATAACTLDIGTSATSATTSSNNLLTALDVGTAAGLFDNISDIGASGKARQKLASGKWVTASKASGASAGLVGAAYIFYVVL